jgi:drug/metabolite transporter (DMT)-like permease
MYIPYRKAYLSGMNPLSFVTVFTVGEVATMVALALVFSGGAGPLGAEMARARPAMFWLFLGGFCWVIGDLFQQYAAKYIGIGRGIPLSNTNQLWGLAWGALVFGELAGQGGRAQALVISGSAVMIVGAVAISSAIAPASEQASWQQAIGRECRRYGLDPEQVSRALAGEDALPAQVRSGRWWDGIIVASSVAIFVWLGSSARRPPIAINFTWLVPLAVAMLALLVGGGFVLWNRTRFS